MKFGNGDFLNCRILRSKEVVRAKGKEKLSYSNSCRDTKAVLAFMGLEGAFTEKSFKVAGVSLAVDKDIPLIDIQSHGRWKNLETPLIYTQKSKKRRLEVSKAVS